MIDFIKNIPHDLSIAAYIVVLLAYILASVFSLQWKQPIKWYFVPGIWMAYTLIALTFLPCLRFCQLLLLPL